MKILPKYFLGTAMDRVRSGTWRSSRSVRLVIAISLTALLALLFPQAQSPQNVTGYSVGALWTNADVTAPFSFRLVKSEQHKRQDIAKALENFYPVFVLDSTAKERSLDSLDKFLDTLAYFSEASKANALAFDTLEKFLAPYGLSSIEISSIESLLKKSDGKNFLPSGVTGASLGSELHIATGKIFSDLYIIASLPSAYSSNAEQKIAVRRRVNEEKIISASELLTKESLQTKFLAAKDIHAPHDAKNALAKIAASLTTPNFSYSPDATEESRKALVDRVPKTEGVILEGQK